MSTLMELPNKSEVRSILYPLGAGNPCVFWPKGERVGDPKPCVMLRRENDEVVTLVEIRPGQNVQHDHVRHVDDDYLLEHPAARGVRGEGYQNTSGGAWDYAPGVRYSWYIPGHVKGLDLVSGIKPQNGYNQRQVAQTVLHMANEGLDAGKIAGTICCPGLTKGLILNLLAAQHELPATLTDAQLEAAVSRAMTLMEKK